MSLYSTIRGCYRRALPLSIRHGLYSLTPSALNDVRRRFVRRLERTGQHDEIYDAEYYAKIIEPTMQLSADAIAASICRDVAPQTAIDIGCGTGGLMVALQARGVKVRGYEYSAAALEVCRRRGLDVVQLDIEHDGFPAVTADLVVSTEVAEHLPERCADRFVTLLCSISSTVAFTAATPGAGGTDHVNEQPNEYWIEKFAALGFAFDSVLSGLWRSDWKAQRIAGCFANSIMVFKGTRIASTNDEFTRCGAPIAPTVSADRV